MTKTILAMGQSNAVGKTPGGVWGIPASVKAWNCTANNDSLTGLGAAFVTPASQSSLPFAGGNNMMVHACRYLSQEFGEDVNLILVAFEGKPISFWCNSLGVTGTMYARMAAVLAAAGVTKVDAFLWHQGEADNGAPSVYEPSWNALVSILTADGYIDADTPIIIGETRIANTPINTVLHVIADADPRVGIAEIGCFPLAADNHFTGPSYVRAGLEYAREIMKIPGPFYREPAPFEDAHVTGAGCSAVTLPSGTFVKVKVKGENGKKTLLDGGAFVADRFGVWEFHGRGCSYAPHVSIAILDETGASIQSLGQFVTPSTSFKPVVDGHAVLALGPGDKVYLGVAQVSGVTVSVPTEDSSLLNRLTAKFLGAE